MPVSIDRFDANGIRTEFLQEGHGLVSSNRGLNGRHGGNVVLVFALGPRVGCKYLPPSVRDLKIAPRLQLTQGALLVHGIAASNEGLYDGQSTRVVLLFQDEFFAQRRRALAAFLVATACEHLSQRQLVLAIFRNGVRPTLHDVNNKYGYAHIKI